MAPQDPLMHPGDQKAETDLPVLTYELAFKVGAQQAQRVSCLSLSCICGSIANHHPALYVHLQLYQPKPELEKLLMLKFDTGVWGEALPLPQRLQVLEAKKMPQVSRRSFCMPFSVPALPYLNALNCLHARHCSWTVHQANSCVPALAGACWALCGAAALPWPPIPHQDGAALLKGVLCSCSMSLGCLSCLILPTLMLL